jgi:hypothetical protein
MKNRIFESKFLTRVGIGGGLSFLAPSGTNVTRPVYEKR